MSQHTACLRTFSSLGFALWDVAVSPPTCSVCCLFAPLFFLSPPSRSVSVPRLLPPSSPLLPRAGPPLHFPFTLALLEALLWPLLRRRRLVLLFVSPCLSAPAASAYTPRDSQSHYPFFCARSPLCFRVGLEPVVVTPALPPPLPPSLPHRLQVWPACRQRLACVSPLVSFFLSPGSTGVAFLFCEV